MRLMWASEKPWPLMSLGDAVEFHRVEIILVRQVISLLESLWDTVSLVRILS